MTAGAAMIPWELPIAICSREPLESPVACKKAAAAAKGGVSTAHHIASATLLPAPKRGFRLRVSAETRSFIVFSLWCGVTSVQFPHDELLLYPLALYYAWAVWRDQGKIAPLLARSWVLLLFPGWCLVSPLWAVNRVEALQQAIYLILTMMICFHVAATMSPRRIMHALLLATGMVGIINIGYAFTAGDIRTGIFAQKNYMGKYMVLLWAVASAVLLDRGSAWWIRMASCGLAGIAAVMVFLSDSATAQILALAAAATNLGGLIFLRGGLLRASRIVAFSFFLTGVAAAGATVLPVLRADPVEVLLNYFGKDETLTGRTELWTYAEDQIAKRPYLGVGAGGYWRYRASPTVQKIYEEFYKRPGDLFNFHSSYYEIAVHQGLIGVALAGVALAWGLYHITRGAFVLGGLPQIYFFTQTLVVLPRIVTEADFLKPFVLLHMILWIGALSAQRAVRARQRHAHAGRFRRVEA
jgi:exopolysaccharide production protein ExoQ